MSYSPLPNKNASSFVNPTTSPTFTALWLDPAMRKAARPKEQPLSLDWPRFLSVCLSLWSGRFSRFPGPPLTLGMLILFHFPFEESLTLHPTLNRYSIRFPCLMLSEVGGLKLFLIVRDEGFGILVQFPSNIYIKFENLRSSYTKYSICQSYWKLYS